MERLDRCHRGRIVGLAELPAGAVRSRDPVKPGQELAAALVERGMIDGEEVEAIFDRALPSDFRVAKA